MVKDISLSLLPREAADEKELKRYMASECGVKQNRITDYKIRKRSIDARGRQAKVLLQLSVYIDEAIPEITNGRSLKEDFCCCSIRSICCCIMFR